MDKIVRQILREMKLRFPVEPLPRKIEKPWWSGICCSQMHYFDLLSMNVEINDIMKPWLIQDYLNTKIENHET